MDAIANPPEASTRSHVLLALTIVAISIGIRFIHLDADPPDWYLTGDIGYHVDEGYKTLSAKNLHVFGTVRWHPDDDYQGWISKSPATQYPIYWAYEFLGLDLAHGRLISLAYTLAFFLITVAFLRRRTSGSVLVLTSVLMATDLAIFQFSRVALFESAQIACLYGSIYLMALVERRSRLLGIIILIVAAILTSELVKAQVPLYFLPAAGAVALSVLFHRFVRNAKLFVVAGVIGICLLLYHFRYVWSGRLDIGAVLLSPQSMFYSPLFALTPVIALAGYLVIIDFVLRDRDALYLSSYRLALTAILVGSPIILSFVDYNPPRYYVPVIPAAILLVSDWLQMKSGLYQSKPSRRSALDIAVIGLVAGSFVMLTMSSLGFWYSVAYQKLFAFRYPDVYQYPIILKAFWGAAALVAAAVYVTRRQLKETGIAPLIYIGIATHIASGLFFQWVSLESPSFQAKNIEQQLVSRMDAEDSVAGDWAPMLTVSSRLRSHYMNTRFNHPGADRFVKPTYFLDAGTYDDNLVLKEIQNDRQISLGEGQVLGTYFRHEITLYPLSYAETQESARNPL